MSARPLRTRKSKITVVDSPVKTEILDTSEKADIISEDGITKVTPKRLRPRKEIVYNNNSLEDTNEGSDASYSFKPEESSSESDSESEFFVKKKKVKVNDDTALVEILKNINTKEDEKNEYRLQRQKNMQDRFKVLSDLEFKDDVKQLKQSTPKPSRVTPSRSKKSVPKVVTPLLPTKRSLRLKNRDSGVDLKNTNGSIENELQFGSVKLRDASPEPGRMTEENLRMVDDGAEEDLQEALNTLKDDLSIPYEPDCDILKCDFTKFSEIVKSCQMKGPPIKVISQRISALDFHPSQKKLILIMGDKTGNIAIRELTKDNGIEFRGHARSTNCVSFSTQDNTKFFSTSLEGTVRQGDVNSSNLRLIYNAADDEHTTWHHEFGHSLLVAEGAGTAKLIDLRTREDDYVEFKCHHKSIRTIQLHPTNDNYFLTGSGYGEFGIWDIRNTKKQEPIILQTFEKALTSAFFSSSGNYVLTTGNDDTVRVFDVRGLQQSTQICRVSHNNHGGRWLSVFKAKWQPQREDVFFIGSMMTNPKRIQAYESNGKMLHQFISPEMNTICPVLVAHPSYPIYVGGNGSGRVHVFSPYSSLSEIFS